MCLHTYYISILPHLWARLLNTYIRCLALALAAAPLVRAAACLPTTYTVRGREVRIHPISNSLPDEMSQVFIFAKTPDYMRFKQMGRPARNRIPVLPSHTTVPPGQPEPGNGMGMSFDPTLFGRYSVFVPQR